MLVNYPYLTVNFVLSWMFHKKKKYMPFQFVDYDFIYSKYWIEIKTTKFFHKRTSAFKTFQKFLGNFGFEVQAPNTLSSKVQFFFSDWYLIFIVTFYLIINLSIYATFHIAQEMFWAWFDNSFFLSNCHVIIRTKNAKTISAIST